MKTKLVLFFSCFAFYACTTPVAEARDVTFAWDKNPEPEVTTYRLEIWDAPSNSWVSISSVADNEETPENDTPTQVEVKGLPGYQFKIRAFAVAKYPDGSSLESLPSEELIVTPDRPGAVKSIRRFTK
jgi:hypothetical protein